MPVTKTEVPILSQFIHAVHTSDKMQAQPQPPPENDRKTDASGANVDDLTPKKLPKGIVLGKDGKP